MIVPVGEVIRRGDPQFATHAEVHAEPTGLCKSEKQLFAVGESGGVWNRRVAGGSQGSKPRKTRAWGCWSIDRTNSPTATAQVRR